MEQWYHYTIYHQHPHFPRQFVVTQMCIQNAQLVQMWVEDTLDLARSYIPNTHVLLMPDTKDDPTILEIWV